MTNREVERRVFVGGADVGSRQREEADCLTHTPRFPGASTQIRESNRTK